jgi:DnaJ-domain-containing protein 1
MEISEYYISTLKNASMNIGPVLGFILAGYFIFFKLPFLFFLKNMKKNKENFKSEIRANENKDEKYSVKDYENFLQNKKKMESIPFARNENKSENKENPKRESSQKSNVSAEDLFGIRPGERFSKDDLKKKYRELLKMNHPDRVASLSEEFKDLADKRTKEINSAYEKLLKKAS